MGNNCHVLIIGTDPYVGSDDNYKWSTNIIEHLGYFGFRSPPHVNNPIDGLNDKNYWYHVEDLGLIDKFSIEWDLYIEGMVKCNSRLIDMEEQLFWSFNTSIGQVTWSLEY